MASLMDMRELGMLRNATQRMDRGGGIDMDEWRRRKAAEEQSVAAQAIAAAQADPRYQALMSGASGGPAAVGSIGNVLKAAPFIRHGPAIGRGLKKTAQGILNKVWVPKKKPVITGLVEHGPPRGIQPGVPGHVSSGAKTAAEVATLGGGGYAANRAFGLLGASPEEEESGTRTVLSEAEKKFDEEEFGLPKKTYPFSPGTLEDIKARQAVGADRHPRMPQVMPQGEKEKEKLVIAPTNTPAETLENTPNLWKTWGSLADNPKERRKAYLSSLKNIFMKRLLLDGMAKLTGGVSQGPAWSAMAVAELDAMELFDSEEILRKQHKALFFREDGTYDPPKNRKEAMERGTKLEYSLDQMKDILTIFPEEKDKRPTLQKNISFILSMEDGTTKRALMKQHGLIETDDLTAAEKSADRAVRNNIISEEEKLEFIRNIFVPKDASNNTAAMQNFEWYKNAEGEDKRLIGELLRIKEDKEVDYFAPTHIMALTNNDLIMDAFSEDEKARIMEIVRGMIKGFGASSATPTFANKEEAQAAANRGEIEVNDKIIVDGQSGTWK